MGVERGVPTVTDAATPIGLTSTEAAERLRRDGPNLLPEPKRASWLRLLVAQLTHLLALLLWVASGLALLAGMPELSAAIVTIILLNGAFAFWQEHRADRSAQELRALLPSFTRVVRDRRKVLVEAAGLVVGDVVMLEAGDRVAADLSVISARGLAMDESLVTGESGAVPRGDGDQLVGGSFVVEGDARCVVAAIGTSTALAGIAALAASAERPPSPLTRQLDRVVRVLAVIAVATGVGLGAAAVGLGLSATEAFLFGVGVAVALVPEGMLPSVTLSLARGAQSMAARRALVRRLDAVETLGATTFICTDKTGTLTQNRMNGVEVVTPAGAVIISGDGYEPVATLDGPPEAIDLARAAALGAVACVTGRAVEGTGDEGGWYAQGDPMEAALHCLALRLGAEVPDHDTTLRRPYTSDRMLTSSLDRRGEVSVLGAPEGVLRRCSTGAAQDLEGDLVRLTASGKRVLAVARRTWTGAASPDMEADLELLGLVALEDPPRPDVREALAACREAGIRVAMISGDHPRTAEAIAREVGLLDEGGLVVTGDQLPLDDAALGALLDRSGGVVVARVSPADKFRIASSLRGRGHVVAMTGDGVNDAPALREADVGIAMGASGSDVAREAADLVLLDDHFATIVAAIELGRATFRNIRRFLTYHLTDNVAELAPFAVWALSGGNYPLAITVLQVLALDIGTDMLPALALGAEPPRDGIMRGRSRRALVDRSLLVRALAVLGLTEAVLALGVCTVVLSSGGWTWGEEPSAGLLAVASGSTFAAIAVAQMANAFACRSAVLPAWRMPLLGNRLVLAAVAAELALLVVFLGVPSLTDLLGGSWPSTLGWLGAGAGAVVLLLVDGMAKRARAARAGRGFS